MRDRWDKIQTTALIVGSIMLSIIFVVIVMAVASTQERTEAFQARLLTEIACILAMDPNDRSNEDAVRQCTNP